MATDDVVVVVLTYRRPEGLGRVLRHLTEHLADVQVEASVLVVDNDDEPSAHEIVAGFPGVRYVHEARPGIVAARNRALDECGTARLLAFIDDDEVPTANWLDALVSTWASTGAAAVVGPVLPQFEAEPDPWVTACRPFDRPRFATGTEMPAAGTGNLLLDLDVVRAHGVRFDERFATSGGSDTFFTHALVSAGARIVWCDEAPVVDIVPAGRMNRSWVLSRAQRMGNSRSRAALLTSKPGLERAVVRGKLACQGVVRVVGGAGRLAFGVVARDLTHRSRGERTLRRGIGMLVGAAGRAVVGYERVPDEHVDERSLVTRDEPAA